MRRFNSAVSAMSIPSSDKASLSPPLHETPILVTREDMTRLRAVVDQYLDGPQSSAAEMLEWELERARVVPQREIPSNVVTMRSRLVFEDVETGERREAVLVYPSEADVGRSMISVLAPVGVALLGLTTGQTISWPVPGGARTRTLRVISILYQPETAGDLHL